MLYYFLIITALVIIGRFGLRSDHLSACGIAIALALFAGTRYGGFDYANLERIVLAGQQLTGEDVFTQLQHTKDLGFLAIVRICSLFSDEVQLTFIVVAAISSATKLAASYAIRGNQSLFLGLYALFLAPGLEFAASRAGMALGFMLLALVGPRSKQPFYWILAILSHISMLIVIASLPLRKKLSARTGVFYILLVVLIPFLAPFLESSERFWWYFKNQGSIFAVVFPLASTSVVWIGWYLRHELFGRIRNGRILFLASSFCICLSLLISIPAVTVSTRILELGLTLALFLFCSPLGSATPLRSFRLDQHSSGSSSFKLSSVRKPIFRSESLLAIFLIGGVLTIFNLQRETWVAMIEAIQL